MVAIGIDLGTTYSCVAVRRNGQVEIIPNAEGERTTPSFVCFNDKDRLYGSAAKSMQARETDNTIFDAKRLIGRKFDDPSVQRDLKHLGYKVVNENDQLKIVVSYNGEKKHFRPEEISAMLLGYLKDTAEKFLGEPVKDAVVTVPAYFNDSQRQATKDAGAIAGLNILRIINEPTAAAIAYGMDRSDGDKKILVFDLGGGTFDVSLLDLGAGGVFTVLATDGDTHLGGEDFDNLVTDFLVSEFNKKNKGMDLGKSQKSMKRLKSAVERAKRTLSSATSAMVEVDSLYEGIDFTYNLTRAKFENLCDKEFRKCLEPVESVLRDAKLDKSSVDDIVMVGGSTRIPKVQKLLSDFFNGKKLNFNINPDEAVAHGAAIQAANLAGDEDMNLLLVDVAPLSLGVDTEGGRTDILIPRQSTIPTQKTKTYSTARDNQPGVTITVHEGERPMTRDNNELGRFQLDGIPPMPRGRPQIDVTFELDANGILSVSAVEKSTGAKKQIQIQNQKGRLSEEEIKKKIQEAEEYKEQDAKNLAKLESRQGLEQYLYGVEATKDKLESATDEDKAELDKVCAEGHAWLSEHTDTTVEEVKEFQKSLEPRVMAVFSKCQSTEQSSVPEEGQEQGATTTTDDLD